MSEVRFPQTRMEVYLAVCALSEPAYQRQVWIDKRYPRRDYYDDLLANVHVLYDDTIVLTEPASTVGTVLMPGEEDSFQALGAALDPVLDRQPTWIDDTSALADPGWPAVVAAAVQARQVMGANDPTLSWDWEPEPG